MEVRNFGIDATLASALVAGMMLSFLLPIVAFWLLRTLSTLDRINRAAIGAHYGSVSIVTFVTAIQYIDSLGLAYEPYMVAVVALMETPAIVTGILLSRASAGDAPGGPVISKKLVREVFLNGSVVLLVGAFLIGAISGQAGEEALKPFTGDLFTGILCLFLLDMGLVAGNRLMDARLVRPGAGYVRSFHALDRRGRGLLAGAVVGLSLGGTVLLATLSASASYIAVPAAMRVALPQANPGIYLTLSLAVTFPFNIMIGIPLYQALAQYFH